VALSLLSFFFFGSSLVPYGYISASFQNGPCDDSQVSISMVLSLRSSTLRSPSFYISWSANHLAIMITKPIIRGTPSENTINSSENLMIAPYVRGTVARHVSRIKDVQRSVADYSHSPYLGCCVCVEAC